MSETDRAAVLEHERHNVAGGSRRGSGWCYASESYGEPMVREAARELAVNGVLAPSGRLRVGTWLTPRERSRVDAAIAGQLDLIHRQTVTSLCADLTAGLIDATLLSAALVRPADVASVSVLARNFPGSQAVGFVGEADEPQALAGAIALGQAGVALLVDARTAAGWSALRGAFDSRHLPDAFIRRALQEMLSTGDAVNGCEYPVGWARFLTGTFSPRVSSAKELAATLGLHCSTLTSRFYRAGLPSPKRYVALARLVWAARLGECPGLTISAIAHRLDASSPQSFGRTVRVLMGVTASEFRRRFDGETMVARFRNTLVDPYRETLRAFDPLVAGGVGSERRGRKIRNNLQVAGRAA